MRHALNTTFAIAIAFSFLLLPIRAQDEPKTPPRESPKRVAPDQAESEPSSVASPKRTWVGVAAVAIETSLRDHLELEEGFGIQVIEVVPDSPASIAGLKKNDILILFEDQRLISPEHLALLVQTKKSGEKVALSLIRKGKEESAEVILGETDAESFRRWPSSHPLPPGHPDPRWQESMEKRQDYWEQWMNQNRPEWRGNPSHNKNPQGDSLQEPRRSRVPVPNESKDPTEDQPQKSTQQRSGPPGLSVNPGFPIRVLGTEGVIKIDNDQGEVTLTRKEGEHTLEIRDAQGKVIHKGPYDPEKGIESLPEAAREQLKIMKLDNLEFRLPEAPSPEPDNINAPQEDEKKESDSPEKIL